MDDNLPPPEQGGDGAAPEPVWARNQIELAEALGCDRKTIGRLLKIEGNPGRSADNRYNIPAWRDWCAKGERLQRKRVPIDKQAIDLRGSKLKMEREEMEFDKERGELLSADEVVEVITGLAGRFAEIAMTRRHDLSHAVVGMSVPEATKRLGRSDRELLEQLSIPQWLKKKAFWSNVSARFSGHLQKLLLSIGP